LGGAAGTVVDCVLGSRGDGGLVLHAENKATPSAIGPRLHADITRLLPHLGYPARMWILLLEALGALALLVFIVWWTMFSGRRRGEPPDQDEPKGR
jgi:hypothetical protein